MITRGCAVVSIRGNSISGSDIAMVFFFVVSVQYVSLNTSGQYYIHRFQEEHVNTHKSSSRQAPPPSHQLSDFVLKCKYQSWCKNNALFKLLLLTLKFVLNYRDTLHKLSQFTLESVGDSSICQRPFESSIVRPSQPNQGGMDGILSLLEVSCAKCLVISTGFLVILKCPA